MTFATESYACFSFCCFRLNGKCLIDEDYLRSIGVEDFERYRCDPGHEPPRMMPNEFPSLLVDEENQSLDNSVKFNKNE